MILEKFSRGSGLYWGLLRFCVLGFSMYLLIIVLDRGVYKLFWGEFEGVEMRNYENV